MNKIYNFVHNKQDYTVEWKEESKILKLYFFDSSYKLLKVRRITLLGVIDQEQLDQIVKDYWYSFIKNELKIDIN